MICILAIGTRGDLQPFRVLAHELATRPSVKQITVAAPCGEIEGLVDVDATEGRAAINYVGVYTAENNNAKRGGSEEEEKERAANNHTHFEECLYLCMDADLIVFNLFALVGWHVASHRGIPAVAASPYLIPYSHPESFPRRFRDAHPELYKRLTEDNEAEEGTTVGWTEVRAATDSFHAQLLLPHWCD